MKGPATGKPSKRARAPAAARKRPPVASARKSALAPDADGALFPVVGVGASAGGLAAICELLEALPARPGMAFVVVSHMDPKGQSMLAALLAQKTPMPVRQARNAERLEPDHVYVAPPGKQLTLRDGRLHASVSVGGPRPTSIDRFLSSLAADRHVAARGVILSGTGTDGSEGLRQVHGEGGITFAQEPASAQFDGMPASAIASGCVDFVLTPAKIAKQLLQLGKATRLAAPAVAGRPPAAKEGDGAFAAILGVLSRVAGVDFSEYKDSTLRRRIARRMALRGFERTADYLADLRAHPDEARHLYAEMLIHVSGFFRDPNAFRVLDRKVIAPLAGKADPSRPIRVWVPGCARGEEVYSIGMLLLERLGPGAGGRRVQLFGSDISAPDIDMARAGRFPAQIAAAVSPARLKRFFDKVPGGYQVRPELRELCVFACQDVGSDPPYSNLDLISCRNLLIYFSRPLQERVLGIFHYALRPDGVLFLGSSESLAASHSPFVEIDKKYHLFRRKEANLLPTLRPSPADGHAALPRPPAPAGATGQPLRQHIDRLLLDRYSPPGFYVDEDLHILEFVGDVSPYLQPSSGQAHLQLTRMLSATMALDIRTAMRSARSSGRTVQREIDWVAPDGSAHALTVAVMRAPQAQGRARGYLVLFERDAVQASAEAGSSKRRTARGEPGELARVARQLKSTREQLQTVVEEQQQSLQELRALNEEAMSSNEELQSSNEELQTAKEELQSANEELATVNEELQNRNQQLDQISTELSTLIAGINIPIIHLDRDRRLRRFSPAAQAAFNLIPSDVGRQFGQIKPSMSLPDLDPLITETIEHGALEEREFQDPSGRWHSLRLRPFPSTGKRIDGALIALVDIDASKRNVAAIVETMSEALLVLDRRFRVLAANPAFHATFGLSGQQTRDVSLFALGNGQWNSPELRRLLEDVLPKYREFADFRVEYVIPRVGARVFRLSGRQIIDEGIGTRSILLLFRDVTDAEASAQRLRDAREQEDKRIAHELHDLSSEGLAALGIELATLASRAPPGMAKGLGAVQARLQSLALSTHDLARRIHPAVLVDLGLVKALLGECRAFEDRHGVPVDFRASGPTDAVPESASLCVYRVLQEALRNIARHARAGQVKVRLAATAHKLALSVNDSGMGFDMDRVQGKGGMGLLGMSDRVAAANGKLVVESAAGVGTTIRIEIPLASNGAPGPRPSSRRAAAGKPRSPKRK